MSYMLKVERYETAGTPKETFYIAGNLDLVQLEGSNVELVAKGQLIDHSYNVDTRRKWLQEQLDQTDQAADKLRSELVRLEQEQGTVVP